MTITEILSDLEAKAKQAMHEIEQGSPAPHSPEWWAHLEVYATACRPNRILALVAYVRKLEKSAREYRMLFPTSLRGKFLQQDRLDDALAGHLDAEERT